MLPEPTRLPLRFPRPLPSKLPDEESVKNDFTGIRFRHTVALWLCLTWGEGVARTDIVTIEVVEKVPIKVPCSVHQSKLIYTLKCRQPHTVTLGLTLSKAVAGADVVVQTVVEAVPVQVASCMSA